MSFSNEDNFEVQNRFQHKLDYENIILQQMGRIAQHRSNKDLIHYQASIDTLVIMLPSILRDKVLEYKEAEGIGFSIKTEGKIKYDLLWEFINKLLEENNLIFHTKYIKSYS